MLRKIQYLQLLWVLLGLGYNAVSYWRLNQGQSALSATDPVTGAIFMVICGVVIIAGLKGADRIYKFAIPVLTLLLGYSGFYLHLSAYWQDASLPAYSSILSWVMVIAINSFGFFALLIGSWLAQKR